jgi:hypothetical protein
MIKKHFFTLLLVYNHLLCLIGLSGAWCKFINFVLGIWYFQLLIKVVPVEAPSFRLYRLCRFSSSCVHPHYRTSKGHSIYRGAQGMAAATKGSLCRVQPCECFYMKSVLFLVIVGSTNALKYASYEGLWSRNHIWPQDWWADWEYTSFSSSYGTVGVWSCKFRSSISYIYHTLQTLRYPIPILSVSRSLIVWKHIFFYLAFGRPNSSWIIWVGEAPVFFYTTSSGLTFG